jgi:hypothetical protein
MKKKQKTVFEEHNFKTVSDSTEKARDHFTLDKTEFKHAQKFSETHHKCKKNLKQSIALGEQFTYLFTITGLGLDIVIKCNYCGKEENITNVDDW